VDQDLLLQNEYLVAENRMLRKQVTGCVWLTDGECTTLAELGKWLRCPLAGTKRIWHPVLSGTPSSRKKEMND